MSHPSRGNLWIQTGLVLALCAALYWPLLGTPGFGLSEGHRVAPAWEMLEAARAGDGWRGWFRIEMFGATYLRKPPGFPWAIAASSTLLGETEFAARAVSAAACTAMALVALWFGRKWFGGGAGATRWGGLAAGVSQACMPQFVSMGRLAEIDATNALGTQFACFGLIELMRRGAGRPGAARGEARSLTAPAAMAALGIMIAGLAKGPASATCLIGVLVAAIAMFRTPRSAATAWVLVALALGGAVLGLAAWGVARANAVSGAVTQDFSEFTWSLSRISGTLLLIPGSWVAALPASLALAPVAFERVFLGRVVHRPEAPERTLAHLLALAWMLSVGLLMLAGISNTRYAMPAAVLLPPLTAYALAHAQGRADASGSRIAARIRAVARWSFLGHPVVIPVLLVPMLLWWAVVRETYRGRREEGRAAGALLAKALPDGAIVWANDLIEARPDVLLYMERISRREHGRSVQAHWRPAEVRRGELPPVDAAPIGSRRFLLVRRDAGCEEAGRYARWVSPRDGQAGEEPPASREPARPHAFPRLLERASGRVASYEFVLYEVVPGEPAHASDT